MFKKPLIIAAAAAAIFSGVSAGTATDAKAGYYSGHVIKATYHKRTYRKYVPTCRWHKRRVRISYYDCGYKRYKWVWRSYKTCH